MFTWTINFCNKQSYQRAMVDYTSCTTTREYMHTVVEPLQVVLTVFHKNETMNTTLNQVNEDVL